MDEDTLPKDFDKFEKEIWKMAPEKTIELLERLPENDQIRLLKANILNKLGRWEEAIECCDKAIEQFTNSKYLEKGIQNEKGEALNSLGRYEEAIECWDKNIKHFEKEFKKSMDTDGPFWSSLYDKAETLQKLGRYEEEIKLREKIMEVDEADDNYHDRCGSEHTWWYIVRRLNDLGRHEEAIKLCDKVSVHNPVDSEVWESKADALEKLGRHEEAIKCWDKAIEIESEYPLMSFYVSKAEILSKLGRHEEAIKCLDEEGKAAHNYDDVWEKYEVFLPKAEALNSLGRHEEAIKCLDEAIELSNERETNREKDFWLAKMRTLYEIGRREDGQKCSEEIKKKFGKKDVKFSDNLNYQAQQFLGEIFGENHKYEVVDGYYGDSMDVWVEGAKDYEVKELHIDIGSWHYKEGYQEVLSFNVIGAGSFFPSISPGVYEEIDDWDEWFRSKGYDCPYMEMWNELETKVREWFEDGRSDWMEVELEGLEDSSCSFMLNIKPLSLEELEPHNIPKLDEINDFLKELKETIDSHKKKTAKKDS
jgi:tetratricopeptide (TPR) repeat protein